MKVLVDKVPFYRRETEAGSSYSTSSLPPGSHGSCRIVSWFYRRGICHRDARHNGNAQGLKPSQKLSSQLQICTRSFTHPGLKADVCALRGNGKSCCTCKQVQRASDLRGSPCPTWEASAEASNCFFGITCSQTAH